MISVSVILCAYNPDLTRLNLVLDSLKIQTLESKLWELILIDNNSFNDFLQNIDLSWKASLKIFHVDKQGLTYSRVKGFQEADGNILILLDDDNVLDNSYLENALKIMNSDRDLGAVGGKSIGKFEGQEPSHLVHFYHNLALRDFGDELITTKWQNNYPKSSPIGAGMVIRKLALGSYLEKVDSGKSVLTDRRGKMLNSGGDNDIVIEILKSGWKTGYNPCLTLQHIIPKERMTVSYLARLNNQSSKSWVSLLESHNINPWKKIAPGTLLLRKIKAWVTYKAWKNKINYIQWRGACGIFEGLAEINSKSGKQ